MTAHIGSSKQQAADDPLICCQTLCRPNKPPLLVLAQAERVMRVCQRLAGCIADPREPARVVHRLEDIFLVRGLAIACGYEDADDLDSLRDDLGFRLALGKLLGAGAGLASQPTMSRWENAPTTRDLAKMLAVMIDIYSASWSMPAPPYIMLRTLGVIIACAAGPRLGPRNCSAFWKRQGRIAYVWSPHATTGCEVPTWEPGSTIGRSSSMAINIHSLPRSAPDRGQRHQQKIRQSRPS